MLNGNQDLSSLLESNTVEINEFASIFSRRVPDSKSTYPIVSPCTPITDSLGVITAALYFTGSIAKALNAKVIKYQFFMNMIFHKAL